jgi:hypothetical protein
MTVSPEWAPETAVVILQGEPSAQVPDPFGDAYRTPAALALEASAASSARVAIAADAAFQKPIDLFRSLRTVSPRSVVFAIVHV